VAILNNKRSNNKPLPPTLLVATLANLTLGNPSPSLVTPVHPVAILGNLVDTQVHPVDTQGHPVATQVHPALHNPSPSQATPVVLADTQVHPVAILNNKQSNKPLPPTLPVATLGNPVAILNNNKQSSKPHPPTLLVATLGNLALPNPSPSQDSPVPL